ncbi:PfkB family carbohydrate kinase [Sphaerochaeta sp. PS]|uniref:PfkB family carbohydrate kinase n=1 Tax=Sphaerochaeta sp. PS TaxID=3076336 RepID=UPI0028A42565|nr:PfkB family carbohydrate kinase [Sphaerochaeta sp. PS]MDT4763302.1 PfkB family carbohydrate kinase [Sphaerochaeta sp. PS]
MIGVIGEALIDFIGKGKEGSSVTFASYIGGCGLNAATAAARLHAPVGFFGKISADMFGVRMLEHLVDNKVLFDPALCASPLPSMIGFASLDDKGKASYAFYSKNTAATTLDRDMLLTSLSDHSDLKVLHIGSVSLVVEPGCDAILAAVDMLKPAPIIFLDPNVRPTVIEDFAAYRERLQLAIQLSDLIKLSDDDLLLLYPDLGVEEAAKRLSKESGSHIILTRGKEGSTWYSPQKFTVDSPIIDLPVVDTVGAGDTFSGALLSYLDRGGFFGPDGQEPHLENLSKETIASAMRFANAAASINCSRKGCDPPTLDEVEALLASL